MLCDLRQSTCVLGDYLQSYTRYSQPDLKAAVYVNVHSDCMIYILYTVRVLPKEYNSIYSIVASSLCKNEL